MPGYSYSVEVAANTQEAANNLTDLQLTRGIITRVHLDFPWGPARHMACRLLHGNVQVIPINPGGYYALDDRLLELRPMYLLEVDPTALRLWTWNISYRNAYTLKVMVEVQDPKVIFPYFALEDILRDLREKQQSLYQIVTGEAQP